eukprot:550017_1
MELKYKQQIADLNNKLPQAILKKSDLSTIEVSIQSKDVKQYNDENKNNEEIKEFEELISMIDIAQKIVQNKSKEKNDIDSLELKQTTENCFSISEYQKIATEMEQLKNALVLSEMNRGCKECESKLVGKINDLQITENIFPAQVIDNHQTNINVNDNDKSEKSITQSEVVTNENDFLKSKLLSVSSTKRLNEPCEDVYSAYEHNAVPQTNKLDVFTFQETNINNKLEYNKKNHLNIANMTTQSENIKTLNEESHRLSKEMGQNQNTINLFQYNEHNPVLNSSIKSEQTNYKIAQQNIEQQHISKTITDNEQNVNNVKLFNYKKTQPLDLNRSSTAQTSDGKVLLSEKIVKNYNKRKLRVNTNNNIHYFSVLCSPENKGFLCMLLQDTYIFKKPNISKVSKLNELSATTMVEVNTIENINGTEFAKLS